MRLCLHFSPLADTFIHSDLQEQLALCAFLSRLPAALSQPEFGSETHCSIFEPALEVQSPRLWSLYVPPNLQDDPVHQSGLQVQSILLVYLLLNLPTQPVTGSSVCHDFQSSSSSKRVTARKGCNLTNITSLQPFCKIRSKITYCG